MGRHVLDCGCVMDDSGRYWCPARVDGRSRAAVRLREAACDSCDGLRAELAKVTAERDQAISEIGPYARRTESAEAECARLLEALTKADEVRRVASSSPHPGAELEWNESRIAVFNAYDTARAALAKKEGSGG